MSFEQRLDAWQAERAAERSASRSRSRARRDRLIAHQHAWGSAVGNAITASRRESEPAEPTHVEQTWFVNSFNTTHYEQTTNVNVGNQSQEDNFFGSWGDDDADTDSE